MSDEGRNVWRESPTFLFVLLYDHLKYLGEFSLSLGRGQTDSMTPGNSGHVSDKCPVIRPNHDCVVQKITHGASLYNGLGRFTYRQEAISGFEK